MLKEELETVYEEENEEDFNDNDLLDLPEEDDEPVESLETIKKKIKPSTKMIPVIKTDGYGHGAIPIAKAVESEQAIWGFGVATAEEAHALREKGIKKLRGNSRGDQYVKVVVETPKHLSDRQKELLRELAKESGDEVHEKRKSFGQKIEDMFKKK